jgi:hypothetical protein
MFIKDDEVINIKVYYKKIAHKYLAYTDKEFEALKLKPEEAAKYDATNVSMKLLSWGLYNDLQENAMTPDGNGDQKFNFKMFKEGRLLKLTKTWDAKDKEGRPIPINEKSILSLSPQVAEAILRAYDEVSYLQDDEEKK